MPNDPQPEPGTAPRVPPRRWPGRLLLATLSAVLCLVALEAALRLATLGSLAAPRYAYYLQMFEPHPTRGWALRPDSEAWLRTPDFSIRHATNGRGFRDVEHAFAKPPGVYRVVVLGDSFIEAGQVDLRDSFTRVLERELAELRQGPVEVINLGCSGYGQVQELVVLREEGLRYDPDLVLLALYPENDLTNNHPELERHMGWFPGRPFARVLSSGDPAAGEPPGLELYTLERREGYMDMEQQAAHLERKDRRRRPWERTLLFDRWQRAFGRDGAEESLRNADPNVWLGVYATRFDGSLERALSTPAEYRRSWDQAFDELGILLAATRDTAEEAGADFLVFTVPAMAQVDPDYRALLRERFPTLELDLDAVNARIGAAAAAHGVALLDLLPAFRAARGGGPPLHHAQDRHWNAAGHHLAAREVARHVVAPASGG